MRYIYNKSAINVRDLHKELDAAFPGSGCLGVSWDKVNKLTIDFGLAVDEDTLNALVAAHTDLPSYMLKRITEMSEACRADIVGGFESAALGVSHYYDSDEVDQLNLIGAVAAGDTMEYGCHEVLGGPKVYKSHTHAQLQQVIRDGRNIKLAKLQAFNTKKAQALQATTKAGVDTACQWP